MGIGAVLARLRIFLCGRAGAVVLAAATLPAFGMGRRAVGLAGSEATDGAEILVEELYTLDMREGGWYSLDLAGASDADSVGETGRDIEVGTYCVEDDDRGDENEAENGIFVGLEFKLSVLHKLADSVCVWKNGAAPMLTRSA